MGGAHLQQLDGTRFEADAVQAVAFQPLFQHRTEGVGEIPVRNRTGLCSGDDENDPVVPRRTRAERHRKGHLPSRIRTGREQTGGLCRIGALQLGTFLGKRPTGACAEIRGSEHADKNVTGIRARLVADGHRVSPSAVVGRCPCASDGRPDRPWMSFPGKDDVRAARGRRRVALTTLPASVRGGVGGRHRSGA